MHHQRHHSSCGNGQLIPGSDFILTLPSNFLVRISLWSCMDAHSKCPEVREMPTTTATRTTELLCTLFETYGLPRQIVPDNLQQFVADEFAHFCSQNGIRHSLSASYYPSTNGAVEHFIQTLKKSLGWAYLPLLPTFCCSIALPHMLQQQPLQVLCFSEGNFGQDYTYYTPVWKGRSETVKCHRRWSMTVMFKRDVFEIGDGVMGNWEYPSRTKVDTRKSVTGLDHISTWWEWRMVTCGVDILTISL